MRTRLCKVNQIKCNFCHQWIITENYLKKTLNICSQCLTKYSPGTAVYDQKGSSYHLFIVKSQQYPSLLDQKSVETAEKDNYSFQNSSKLLLKKHQQKFQGSSLSLGERQLIESRILGINRETQQQVQNIVDLIKRFSDGQSKSFLKQNLLQDKPPEYQSHILSQKPITINFLPIRSKSNKKNKLDDYCQNLEETRYRNTYQYYFDSAQISRFKKNNTSKKIDSCFASDIENYSQDQLFLNIGRYNSKKSLKSNSSIDPYSFRNYRLSDETLRNKIASFLQSKYQSTALSRIIAMNTKQAYQKTNIHTKMIQLISFKISSIDLVCYLNLFQEENLNTIKLINVGLNDDHLAVLIDFIWGRRVERLVLSGNRLTDSSLVMFLGKSFPFLKELYLGKNRISKYRMKQNIVELRSKFVVYL